MTGQDTLFDLSDYPADVPSDPETIPVLQRLLEFEHRMTRAETILECRLVPLQAQLDGAEAERDVLRQSYTEALDALDNMGDHITAMLAALVTIANAHGLYCYQSVDTFAPLDMATVIFIDLPAGQVRWHVLNDDRHHFEHLPSIEPYPADASTLADILARLIDPWTFRPVSAASGRAA